MALRDLGHDVAISAFAGCHEEREWQGFPIMGVGSVAHGNGAIAGNYARWKADLLVTLTDTWVMLPYQFAGLTVLPWVPIDCDPLSVMDTMWLAEVAKIADLHPVAMSAHGSRVLAGAGWGEVPVVPHAAGPAFHPGLDRSVWRRENGVPAGTFLVAKIGVNNEDDRKAFDVSMQAFAALVARHPGKVALYLHTEAQPHKGPNLARMALNLGLKHYVKFADGYRRSADLYPATEMASMLAGADMADVVSRGEGYGVPAAEALACGTPVTGCRNSAMTEKISAGWGWLAGGQREWIRHHQSWWVTPSVAEVARAYEAAYAGARRMRGAAAKAGAGMGAAAMGAAWERVLAGL